MNKTKLVALCGVCGAVAVLGLVALSYVKWVALALAVVVSVVACTPQILNGRYGWYSFATYVVAVTVAAFVGNVLYVAPVAIFAMPFCMWKLFCQHKQSCKLKLYKVLKWLGGFVLANCALVVSGLLVYLLMPTLWESLVQQTYVALALVVAVNLAVIAYDKLLNGAIYVVKNALNKSKFGQQ